MDVTSDLELEIRQSDDVQCTVELKGRLDAFSTQQLKTLAAQLRASGTRQLLLDVQQVSFVASSGLATFLLLTEEYREAGGDVVVVAPSPPVQRVINLLNLGQFLHIENTVAAALASMKS